MNAARYIREIAVVRHPEFWFATASVNLGTPLYGVQAQGQGQTPQEAIAAMFDHAEEQAQKALKDVLAQIAALELDS